MKELAHIPDAEITSIAIHFVTDQENAVFTICATRSAFRTEMMSLGTVHRFPRSSKINFVGAAPLANRESRIS